MGHHPFCPFLACHHLHNVKQKQPILIKWAKILLSVNRSLHWKQTGVFTSAMKTTTTLTKRKCREWVLCPFSLLMPMLPKTMFKFDAKCERTLTIAISPQRVTDGQYFNASIKGLIVPLQLSLSLFLLI